MIPNDYSVSDERLSNSGIREERTSIFGPSERIHGHSSSALVQGRCANNNF